MRNKIIDELKKKKISICLHNDVILKLQDRIKQENSNRSKYIENLIKNDLNM